MHSELKIPPSVEAAGTQTTARILASSAQKWPQNIALLIDGTAITYEQMFQDTLNYAAGLHQYGVKQGSRVGILSPNSADYVRLFYACGMLGATLITLNARFKEGDLDYSLNHSDVEYLFIGENLKSYMDFRTMLYNIYPDLKAWNGQDELCLQNLPTLKRIVAFGGVPEQDWPTEHSLIAALTPSALAYVKDTYPTIDSTLAAIIIYSSGTTANPKACILSHKNLAQIAQSFAERFRLSHDDVIYNPMPYFHMSSMLPMAACRAVGAMQICTAHFKPYEALDQIKTHKATFAYVSFPTIVSGLLNDASFSTAALASVKLLHVVGPADLLRRYNQQLPHIRFVNAYGLTEASGVPVWSDPFDPNDDPFISSGTALCGIEIASFDPDTGEMLAPNQRGELRLRGFCQFMGYLKDQNATQAAISPDGWLRSGDLGYVSETGVVTYDGRLKDMLKIGGENVAALEIENYLCKHPAIEMAQVIAVPDDHLFEVAAAYIQLRPDMVVSSDGIIEHCLGNIASYKVPRYIRFVTEWPMSSTKVQKFKLSREFGKSEYFDIKTMMQNQRKSQSA